jgi:hypothetical protein
MLVNITFFKKPTIIFCFVFFSLMLWVSRGM